MFWRTFRRNHPKHSIIKNKKFQGTWHEHLLLQAWQMETYEASTTCKWRCQFNRWFGSKLCWPHLASRWEKPWTTKQKSNRNGSKPIKSCKESRDEETTRWNWESKDYWIESVESSTRHHNENHNIQLDKTMKTPRVINAAIVDDDINQSQEYFNVGS